MFNVCRISFRRDDANLFSSGNLLSLREYTQNR